MITIKHVLKDGTQVDSIEGKVIKADQHELLYEIINRMQKEYAQKYNIAVCTVSAVQCNRTWKGGDAICHV